MSLSNSNLAIIIMPMFKFRSIEKKNPLRRKIDEDRMTEVYPFPVPVQIHLKTVLYVKNVGKGDYLTASFSVEQ